jgi:predicted amidohydrolase YtcJ
MLIRNAEIHFSEHADLRIEDGIVVEIGAALRLAHGETIVEADGNALLPGLHDHHLHFMSYAAGLDSVACGPPHIGGAAHLAQALRTKAATTRGQNRWIRGIGYHESVAGEIDRHWLDRVVPEIPVRIQQRSGRLWILNSRALEQLGELAGSPLESRAGEYTGRLYDADDWLRARIGRQLPDVRAASRQLAEYGVTGFTDTSPGNDPDTFELFAQLQRGGDILQDVVLMGGAGLHACAPQSRLRVGATKVHMHDSELPEFEALCATIRRSHADRRPVAIHCVTLTELVFSLNAFREAGTQDGDRIEHAAIAPPDIVEQIAQLQLIVVTQPNFIAERGAAYLRDVDPVDQPWLYRLRGFVDAGIRLAGGTDAPFGAADPWAAMQAATTRSTGAGQIIGTNEALTPEAALELFLGDPLRPGTGVNRIERGQRADFCLLDRPWQIARADLAAVKVRAMLAEGRLYPTPDPAPEVARGMPYPG